jgi:hypothetical protein
MAYNLFLDDFRMPKDAFEYMKLPIYISVEWIIVRNYYAFITLIENKGVPDIISFDHDLADEHYNEQIVKGQTYQEIYDMFTEKTGYHCAKWLIDYCIDNNKKLPADILIHSMNPAGSMNIKSLFETYFKVYNIDQSGDIFILSTNKRI